MFFDLLRHIIRTFGTRFLQLDVAIPEPLRMYMGGKDHIE